MEVRGGGGSSTQALTIDSKATQRLVRGSPPVETGVQQDRRWQEIYRRSDSNIDTGIFFDFSDGVSFWTRATCSGSVCVHRYPTSGDTETNDLSSGASFFPGTTFVTRWGITLEYINRSDWLSLASALDHSTFNSHIYRDVLDGVSYSQRLGSVYGDSTGSPPSFSGTWRGLMTSAITGNDDLLQGEVLLRYSSSELGESISVTFDNIKNVSKNRDYRTRSNVVFGSVPVKNDGTFLHVSPNGNKIQGAFYGGKHEEASGVFEYAEMLGAFGTKKSR